MSATIETFDIDGMSCGHCVRAVREALEETPGVHVDHVEIGRARVDYDTEEVSRAQIVEAIEEAGYAVRSSTTDAR